MSLSCDDAIDQVGLELARHLRCAFAALADEPHAPRCEPFYGGDADVARKALGNDQALIQGHQEDAAHLFSDRFAAAIASLALL